MTTLRTRKVLAGVALFLIVFQYTVSLAFTPNYVITTPGPKKTYVIPVMFSDISNSTDLPSISRKVFFEMNEYYIRASNNKISIIGDMYGSWVVLQKNITYYGEKSGKNQFDGDWQLIHDAIMAVDEEVDFSSYESVIVVHAGKDEASTKNSSDIWSKGYWDLTPSIKTDDKKIISRAADISEDDPLGIYAHEFGHILGLPDLYNRNESGKEFVGPWDLMATGSWNGDPPGSQPAWIGSWGQIQLGWINDSQIFNVEIGQSVNVTISALESTSSDIKVIKIPITDMTYYLIEGRNDEYLPDKGVIISFINESLDGGMGIVVIQDAHPITQDNLDELDDAAFNVDEIFEDPINHFTVKVVAHSDYSSFVLQVSPKLKIHLESNIFDIPDSIVANGNISIWIRAKNYNNDPISDLNVSFYLDGEQVTTQITDEYGYARAVINFDLSKVGSHLIQVRVEGNDSYLSTSLQTSINILMPSWFNIVTILIVSVILIMIAILIIRKIRGRTIGATFGST